jgi:hypothetical protein
MSPVNASSFDTLGTSDPQPRTADLIRMPVSIATLFSVVV